jgi:hypothetical protein
LQKREAEGTVRIKHQLTRIKPAHNQKKNSQRLLCNCKSKHQSSSTVCSNIWATRRRRRSPGDEGRHPCAALPSLQDHACRRHLATPIIQAVEVHLVTAANLRMGSPPSSSLIALLPNKAHQQSKTNYATQGVCYAEGETDSQVCRVCWISAGPWRDCTRREGC